MTGVVFFEALPCIAPLSDAYRVRVESEAIHNLMLLGMSRVTDNCMACDIMPTDTSWEQFWRFPGTKSERTEVCPFDVALLRDRPSRYVAQVEVAERPRELAQEFWARVFPLYTSPSPRDRTRSRIPSSACKKKICNY